MDYALIKNKIEALSNHYYNEGIEAIALKDMSLAISYLKQSLKYNKENIDARNLLGLVYYGIGEYTQGMAEWIISANQQALRNVANEYLKECKNDEEGLIKVNENIKRYNKAIDYINEGTYDLAILQLSRASKQDRSWIRPRLLLGLVFLSQGQLVKGRMMMQEVLKRDRGNILAKKALNSIKKTDTSSPYDDSLYEEKNVVSYKVGNETIIQPKDVYLGKNKPKWFVPAVSALITFLVVWFLLVPARIRSVTKENNAAIESLKTQIAALNDEKVAINQEEEERAKTEAEIKKKQKEDLKKLQGYYDQIQSGEYNSSAIVEALDEIDVDFLTKDSQALYDAIMSELSDAILREYSYEGYNAYTSAHYKKCIRCYEKVVAIDEQYYDGACLYQLASAYAKTGNKEKAIEYFTRVVQLYPNDNIGAAAQQYLDENAEE